ncbi:MAG: adenylate cyclase [Verrucomicrobiaceae bacterium]|nr:adenylate cyclase [Verrucomicrobiaceae bacterium]
MQTQTNAALEEGFDRKALKVIKQRFLQVNEARLERTKSALDARQQVFLDLLALLFHVNHPMLPGYVSHQTPCGVSEYNPSKIDIERGQRLARSFVHHREPNVRRRIHSLFLMGSCGTIAQSNSSDLDIWICHQSDLSAEEIILLQRKCADIEKWAMTFTLEVHFFLMEPDKFRLGEREGLSSEDCGSAQHYLLLDEFYRTGLLIAGRIPIWWLIPPDQEMDYNAIGEEMRHKRFVRGGETLDFGSVAHIPAGEFIGAGIWQLYKAIDSPYKSVIKLLLTEVYASEYPHVEPLSTTFKRAIYKKVLDIDELDPYVMMYRKLERYLLARGENKRLDLVRRCFYFKVGKAISKGPSQRTKSWQRELLERMVMHWRWSKAQLINLDARPHWKVTRVLNEQKELVRELTNSYRFLLEFARRTQVTAVINGQDMTILGRKLYAAFERKAGKVEWVNPGIAPKLSEVALTFCQLPGSHNEQLAWAVVPEQINTREIDQAQPMRRSNDLISLLAWCHINGLMDADTRTYIVPGEHGVSEFELQNTVRAMRTRLPQQREESGDPDNHDRFLSPNRPNSMQLFINLGIDPMAQIRARGMERLTSQTDSLVYSGLRENLVLALEQITVNSWGDVSTRSYRGSFALLQCLRDYLQLLPPQQQPGLPALDIRCFCPTRAAAIATRVEQLFQDIAACYYSGTRPAATRYILEMQREFYMLQWQDAQPTIQRAPNYAALLELLGRVQRIYSPIVLDRNCLPNSLLEAIAQLARADCIKVIYQRRESAADVFVIDEMGSLYNFTTPFRDEQTLLQPLHQFMLAALFRQGSETAEFVGGTHDVLLETGAPRSIEYYEVVSEQTPVYIERRTVPPQPGNQFFNVQAIADYDFNNNLIFNVYCDQQEFTELELGNALYDTVARYILSQRSDKERYPCYITDIDLSRCVNDVNGPQTVHYLRYKQRLERALNEALASVV